MAFVEVDMSVDIGWCNEVSFCIHFYVRGFIQMLYNGLNAATTDGDIPGPRVLSEASVSNDQVHACILVCGSVSIPACCCPGWTLTSFLGCSCLSFSAACFFS